MRKLLIFTLLLSLLVVLFPSASFADTKMSTYQIPISNYDASTLASSSSYTFDIPFPTDATDVDISSVTFNPGHGSLASIVSKDTVNRKFTVKINGEAQSQGSFDVYGYSNPSGKLFSTEPGDNEWRYSSGAWQINSLDRYCVANGNPISACQTTATFNGIGSQPTEIPYQVLTTVSQPLPVSSAISWFKIDNLSLPSGVKVDTSTIQLSDESHTGPTGQPDISGKSPAKNVHQYFGTTIVGDQDTSGSNYMPADPSTQPSGAGTGPYVEGRNYFVTFNYALHAKTLPTTVYAYNGTVTFNYTSSPDPYVGITADANPSQVCFDNNDISVDIPAYSTLFNVSDQYSVDYWKFYAKVDGDDSTLQQNLTASPNLTNGANDFTFTIPASDVASDPYTVKYKVTAIAVMKQTDAYLNPVTYQATTYTSITISQSQCSPPSPPPPMLFPPVVNLTVPKKVRAGDDVPLSAVWAARNPGGYITHAIWWTGGETTLADMQKSGTTWYAKEGSYGPMITVEDNYNLSGNDYKYITVTPPTITPTITYTGTLKENRKVTFSETANTPTHFPEDSTKTTWQIAPYSGGATAAAIKYVGSLSGVDSIDTLFKTAGTYIVTVTVTNTDGYSGTASKVIQIAPDLPPVTNFHITNQVVDRDPKNNNLATIDLWDDSYSPDGDTIVQRIWKYAYDSNNDGNFNDENWIIIDSGNKTHVQITTNQVGFYKFELQTVEAFGQPTISQFITSADYRTSNTWQ